MRKIFENPRFWLGGMISMLSHGGERLAWIEWSHPYMHWDKAELWVGFISQNGDVYKRSCVAGGDQIAESPTEPRWSSKGDLFFITDRKNGFWNIYKWNESNNDVRAIYSLGAEFTRPLWDLGNSSYDIIQSDVRTNILVCSYRHNGKSYLGVIDEADNTLSQGGNFYILRGHLQTIHYR